MDSQGERRRLLEWSLDDARARVAPPRPPESAGLAALAGRYGPRLVTFADGALFYQRDKGQRYALEPLGGERFRTVGLDWFRVRFERDEGGRGTRLHGLYLDGRTDVSERRDEG